MTTRLFQRGDRLWNTGNKLRKTIGVVSDIIDDDYCHVLWSDGEGYAHTGTIRRDGTVEYGLPSLDEGLDRIVRVKLSVRIAEDENVG